MNHSLFSRNSIYSSKIEIFSLLLPVCFLILIFFELSLHNNILDNFTRYQVSILGNVVLLNITHNAFTIILLTSHAPLQKWLTHHGGQTKFWSSQLIILSVLTVFFSVLVYMSTFNHRALVIFTIAGFFFAAHHAISQSFGLSLIYNNNKKNTVAEKVERVIFNLFLFLNLFFGSLVILYYFKGIFLEESLFLLMRKYSFFIICILGAGLIILPLIFYGREGISKSIFNLRYLFWPLTFFSGIAIFATLAVHGVEYGLIIHKMFNRESVKKPVLAMSIVSTVIIFALIRINSFEIIKAREILPVWLFIATGLSIAFSFLHYYLDRLLFKMRVPANREMIAPLLINNNFVTGRNEND